MAATSFNLRKWNSNSRELLQQMLPEQIKEAELQGSNQCSSPGIIESLSEALLNLLFDLGKSCTESEVTKLLSIT